MRKNKVINWIIIYLPCFLLLGCTKDYTRFYGDAEDEGITIFSDNGNNILSCYIDGKPWRTIARITSGMYAPRTSYEVDLAKQPGNSTHDTLIIMWQGNFTKNENSQGYIRLHLAMPANFSYPDLTALQGKRLGIDATNGYFSTSISGVNAGNTKGSGFIYFHRAQFDSIAPGVFSGKLSGLFDADFSTFKITRGRFDHFLWQEQLLF